MKISEKLIKPITETKYLSVDNVARYRTIIRFFYVQYEKIKYWLYKEEIFNELSKYDIFLGYTMDECKSDLSQLTEWGNLIADQDSSKVYTIEDFKNKQFRYQLSDYSVEIERMTIKLENLFIEGSSLEPTLLERLREELSKFSTIKNQNDFAIYSWWDNINNDFIRLNQNYQDYIRDLNSVKAEEMMKTEEFLVFKDKLIEYLRTFIKSMQKNTSSIENIIKSMSENDVNLILNSVLNYELSIPRLDGKAVKEDILEIITGRFENIKGWFVGENDQSEAIKLFDATNDIIRRITRYAIQITEIFNSGANRKEEYRKLSEIFLNCDNIGEAHKLSALVFGIEKPIHIKGDFSRNTESINSGVFEEEAFIVKLEHRSKAKSEKYKQSYIINYKEQKEKALQDILKQYKKEEEVLESYIVDDKIEFSKLPIINKEARKVLLIWLEKGLNSIDKNIKTNNGKTFYIDKSNKENMCTIKCNDGIFEMPDYKIIFNQCK